MFDVYVDFVFCEDDVFFVYVFGGGVMDCGDGQVDVLVDLGGVGQDENGDDEGNELVGEGISNV